MSFQTPFFRRNVLPPFDPHAGYEHNFDTFFGWAQEFKQPERVLLDIVERQQLRIRKHPIGFLAIYLTAPDEGIRSRSYGTLVRVNYYPAGEPCEDDIHCHPFNFRSGVVKGVLLHTLHTPDRSIQVPDGEGLVGYESWVDEFGQNHTVRVTDATIARPASQQFEILPGQSYTMKPLEEFHSVQAEGETLTVFCKTPTPAGQDGRNLVLRDPRKPAPPTEY